MYHVRSGENISLKLKMILILKMFGALVALGLVAFVYSLIQYNLGFFPGTSNMQGYLTILMVFFFGFVTFAMTLMFSLTGNAVRTLFGLCLGLLFLRVYWSITLHLYKGFEERWVQNFLGSLFHPITLLYNVYMDLSEGLIEDRMSSLLKYVGFIASGIIGAQDWFKAMMMNYFRKLFPTD